MCKNKLKYSFILSVTFILLFSACSTAVEIGKGVYAGPTTADQNEKTKLQVVVSLVKQDDIDFGDRIQWYIIQPSGKRIKGEQDSLKCCAAGGPKDSAYYNFPTPGIYTIEIEISDDVSPPTYQTKIYSWEIKVLPDLTISKIWTKPSRPLVGEQAPILLKVKNQGGGSAHDIDVDLRIDAGVVKIFTIDSLRPHSTATQQYKTTFQIADEYRLSSEADPGNKILESDEQNNYKESSVQVFYPPELVEVGISKSDVQVPGEGPIEFQPGGTVRLWYKVKNPNDKRIEVGLGASLRNPNGEILNDPSHDDRCTAIPGAYWCNRFFDIPSDAMGGLYDVAWGLWDKDFSEQYERIWKDDWVDVKAVGGLKVYTQDKNGAKISGAILKLYGSSWRLIGEKETNSEGWAKWEDLTTGTYHLELYNSGEFWVGKEVNVQKGLNKVTLRRRSPYVADLKITEEGNGDGIHQVGEKVNIAPEIYNGAPTARDVKVQIFADKDQNSPWDDQVWRGPKSIARTDYRWFGRDFVPDSSGTYHVKIRVKTKYDGRWVLTDDTNWQWQFNVPPPRLPDLVVSNILINPSINPSTPRATCPTVVQVEVKNQGNQSSGPPLFSVQLYIDGRKEREIEISDLNRGATWEYPFSFPFSSPGKHTIKVVADGRHDVTESNENNNERVVKVTVNQRFVETTGTVAIYSCPKSKEADSIAKDLTENISKALAENILTSPIDDILGTTPLIGIVTSFLNSIPTVGNPAIFKTYSKTPQSEYTDKLSVTPDESFLPIILYDEGDEFPIADGGLTLVIEKHAGIGNWTKFRELKLLDAEEGEEITEEIGSEYTMIIPKNATKIGDPGTYRLRCFSKNWSPGPLASRGSGKVVVNPFSLTLFDPTISGKKVTLNGVVKGADRLEWDWGDGIVEKSGFPNSHTYSSDGIYPIKVTAYCDSRSITKSKVVAVGSKEEQTQSDPPGDEDGPSYLDVTSIELVRVKDDLLVKLKTRVPIPDSPANPYTAYILSIDPDTGGPFDPKYNVRIYNGPHSKGWKGTVDIRRGSGNPETLHTKVFNKNAKILVTIPELDSPAEFEWFLNSFASSNGGRISGDRVPDQASLIFPESRPLVKDFNASDGEDSQSTLTWTNPSDSDLADISVRRKTGSYPTDHNDGKKVDCNISVVPATSNTCVDTGLKNGKKYYYAVFSKDSVGWNDKVQENKNADWAIPGQGPTLSTKPQNLGVEPQNQASFNVILSNLSNGVKDFNVEVALKPDNCAAEIIDIGNGDFTLASSDKDIAPNGKSVLVAGFDPSGQVESSGNLGTIKVKGLKTGKSSCEIALKVNSLENEDGDPIQPSIQNGKLNIGSGPPPAPGGEGPPTDGTPHPKTAKNGKYEDVDGDKDFDIDDPILLARLALDLEPGGRQYLNNQSNYFDFDGDGDADIDDAINLARIFLCLEPGPVSEELKSTATFPTNVLNSIVKPVPAKTILHVGETQQIGIVLEEAPNGIKSYAIKVSLSPSNLAAEITDIEDTTGNNLTFISSPGDISSDGKSVILAGFSISPTGSLSNVNLGSIKVKGLSSGAQSGNIKITLVTFKNSDGKSFGTTSNGSLSIEGKPPIDWSKSGIFPIPANSSTGSLHIEGDFDTVTLMIFDLSGRKLLDNNYSQNDATVNLSNLDNGVYLYVLIAEKDGKTSKSPVKKLLVQR